MTAKHPISLNEKVVLVTGGSRGIGAAIAHACAAAGAKVVVASRKQPGVDAVAQSIRDAGGEAVGFACHMGAADQIQALYEQSVAHFGRVDVLINNAATNPYFGPMLDIEEAAFDKTVDVNMKGYFYAIRGLVRHLRDRKAETGAVVNVASVVGFTGAPFQGVYAMTKAAVISMTKTLAHEVGPAGIRVNAIAPGLVDTKFASAIVNNPAIADQVVRRTPAGRVGSPDDIAGAAVYLASDAARFVHGEVLVVDGGLTTGM